jgi:hypothetical protein
MKFDDIKTQWTAYDKELDNSMRLNIRLLNGWQKTNSAIQKLSRSAVIEMILGVLTAAVLGGFLYDHSLEMAFFIPALVLDAFVVFQVAFSGYQFTTLREIDFSAPILVSQKKLATLRRQRIQVTMWTLTLSPLLWVPLLIVILKGLLGLNVYELFDTTWLLTNMLFGLAVIPLMIWVSRRLALRWKGSALVKQLLDSVAGHELTEMNSFLENLKDFEQDEHDRSKS